MPNSFLRRSALSGPTPFKYSMELDNMETVVMIAIFLFYSQSSNYALIIECLFMLLFELIWQ